MTNNIKSVNGFDFPLAGVRVLDMADGKGEMCGRLLADLGADVILVEPPGGMMSRHQDPLVNGKSLYFETHNANKRSVTLDLTSDAGRESFLNLVNNADMLIETTRPGTLEGLGIGVDKLHQVNPELVVLSMTDFGQTGPYRDFFGTDSVHAAMSGVLCRSGLPGSDMPPLLPPGRLAYETSAIQACWALLVAYWQRLNTGVGDHVDFSFFEGTAQIFDPVLGVTGSAAAGRSSMQMAEERGRPNAGHLYPIFPCADGHVRMCILNPRQWKGMCEWLGDDHPFTDPSYGNLFKRMKEIGEINALIKKMTSNLSTQEVVDEGQQRGIPVAALAKPHEVLDDEHFNARRAFTELQVDSVGVGKVPHGYLEVDGVRMGIRTSAPEPGENNDEIFGNLSSTAHKKKEFETGIQRRPLEGIRVLDLGVIVAGAELGRILADQGAEVIKVENRAFPDGGRQSGTPDKVSFSFAQGHRGKESLGLNLRSDNGVKLFKELAAKSDLILSNFKPGTMESLGIGYDVIREINPRIVMADSSALGRSGPLSRSMGYGPLVRASTGLTGLWCYPEVEESFCDGMTIVPDHFAARVSGIGVLAQLIRRRRTGSGGTVSVSQAETILSALSTEFLRESFIPGSLKPQGNHAEFTAPDGLFPCAGDDEWCVVSVQDQVQWRALCDVINREDLLRDLSLDTSSGRVSQRKKVNEALELWTRDRSPEEVMKTLQGIGIPAGKMYRLSEIGSIEHLRQRCFFRSLKQPGYDEAWPTENAPARSCNMPDPDIRPAPLQGEHTRQVAARVLGLDDSAIQELVDSGDLELVEEL